MKFYERKQTTNMFRIYKMTNDINPDFMKQVSHEKKKPSQHLPAQIY